MINFFDTSALQHRYLDTPKSRSIRRIISDRRNTCFISNITILEIASTFALHCRRNGWALERYQQLDKKFWRDIKSGVLQVREARRLEFRKALHLLEYAGAELRRQIKSADALIAASCLELALERSERVRFCVEDKRLYSAIHQLAAYKSAIDFRYIGPPIGTS